MAELLQGLLRAGQDHVHRLGTLPANAVYTFDRLAEEAQADQVLPPVLKTRRRKVVSLRFGAICCREVIRQGEHGGGRPHRGGSVWSPKGCVTPTT